MKGLVLLLPGFGDALAASPIFSVIRDSPEIQADALTMLESVAEYARSTGVFEHVYNRQLLDNLRSSIPKIFELRRERYDFAIVPFPATRWQYAAVATAVGARVIYAHDYGGSSRNIFLAANAKLVSLRGGHRIAENKRLAQELVPGSDPPLKYLIPPDWATGSRRTGLVGVHTGTMQFKGNERRRWPLNNFAEFVDRQLGASRHVRVFIGPNERSDREFLERRFQNQHIEFIEVPLNKVGPLLAECEIFVGNDSGLTHLAAGVGAKVITLFGMTDPVRATPVGNAYALRPSDCPPCHDEGMRTFSCVRSIGYKCMIEDMTVDRVCETVDAFFSSAIIGATTAIKGDFQLYGKRCFNQRET